MILHRSERISELQVRIDQDHCRKAERRVFSSGNSALALGKIGPGAFQSLQALGAALGVEEDDWTSAVIMEAIATITSVDEEPSEDMDEA